MPPIYSHAITTILQLKVTAVIVHFELLKGKGV